jgi:hypothetical protein
MTNGAAAASMTQELAALLKDQPHLADFISALGHASSESLEAAAPLYQSLQMWGGPGSVADAAGVDLPPRQQERVAELIVALFDEFERAGIHHDRAPSWASFLASGLESSLRARGDVA